MKNFHHQNNQNFDRCLVSLRNSMLRCGEKQLIQLIHDFDQDPLAIMLLISYLENWHDGQLSGLEYIPVLSTGNQQQDRSLKRLLFTFERQFSGCAELTLLHLMSFSTKPVLLDQMEAVFRRSLIKRLLSRRGDYQQFLAPLSKLNGNGWDKVIENLHHLNLLYSYESDGEQLLHIEQRIGLHFRESLEAQQYYIMQRAYEDMILASSMTTAYGVPKASADSPIIRADGTFPPNYGLPTKSSNKQRLNASNANRTVDVHSQLRALRYRLGVLKAQSRELNAMMLQSPAFQQRRTATKLYAQQNSRVA